MKYENATLAIMANLAQEKRNIARTKIRAWTVKEYHRMIGTGILRANERVELRKDHSVLRPPNPCGFDRSDFPAVTGSGCCVFAALSCIAYQVIISEAGLPWRIKLAST